MIVLTVVGFGFGTWASFLGLARQSQRRAWYAWSALYGALIIAFIGLEATANAGLAAVALILAWLGGTTHISIAAKGATRRIRGVHRLSDGTPVLVAARERIRLREKGRHLAAKEPELAREVGVGRPDLPGAEHYGLVDVNHASPNALCQLPGVTPEVAERITDTRRNLGPFSSAEDLCVTLDLPPALTDDLRDHAVFL